MSLMNVPEDLSGMSRTDLVYKAKLAEQAERCVRHSHFGVGSLNKDAGRGWLFFALAYPRPSLAFPGSSWIVPGRRRRGRASGRADTPPATTPGARARRVRARRADPDPRVFFGSAGRATRTTGMMMRLTIREGRSGTGRARGHPRALATRPTPSASDQTPGVPPRAGPPLPSARQPIRSRSPLAP